MVEVTDEEFEAMINDALDTIPDAFAEHMTNMVILARDYNEEQPWLLGLFEGVPLPEQHSNHTGFLPDAVFIYKEPLQEMCATVEQLRHEVKVTVLHEVGHYFGMEEHELHALGWG